MRVHFLRCAELDTQLRVHIFCAIFIFTLFCDLSIFQWPLPSYLKANTVADRLGEQSGSDSLAKPGGGFDLIVSVVSTLYIKWI